MDNNMTNVPTLTAPQARARGHAREACDYGGKEELIRAYGKKAEHTGRQSNQSWNYTGRVTLLGSGPKGLGIIFLVDRASDIHSRRDYLSGPIPRFQL
jgi:hypothetical protein